MTSRGQRIKEALSDLYGPVVASRYLVMMRFRWIAIDASVLFSVVGFLADLHRMPVKIAWPLVVALVVLVVGSGIVWVAFGFASSLALSRQFTGGSRINFVLNAPIGRPARFPTWCEENGYVRIPGPPVDG